MRRKRLNHAADTLCQMFRGWRLVNSYHALAALGSGTLVIDALGGTCTFNGSAVEPLTIAGELHAWLSRDLEANNIPVDSIHTARLTALLQLSSLDGKGRVTGAHHMTSKGKPIRGGKFHRLVIHCQSEITTADARYAASTDDLAEWPENWP